MAIPNIKNKGFDSKDELMRPETTESTSTQPNIIDISNSLDIYLESLQQGDFARKNAINLTKPNLSYNDNF